MNERRFGDADLHAYLDGEMPAEERAAFETWLDDNPDERQRLASFAADRDRLREALDPVLDEAVPEQLLALFAATAATRRRAGWRRMAAAIALIALGGAAGWFANDFARPAATPGMMTVEAALSAHHVYVTEVRHAVEVSAAEEPHLVTWLSKRLGQPLTVPVLTDAGFDLVGGRLLPENGTAAAQFMYENAAGDRITLYVATNPDGGRTAFRLVREGDTNAFYWMDGPLGFALAGAIDSERLQRLSHIVYGQLDSSQG